MKDYVPTTCTGRLVMQLSIWWKLHSSTFILLLFYHVLWTTFIYNK